MKFGMYAVRDVKSGFQTPTCQVNDAVALLCFSASIPAHPPGQHSPFSVHSTGVTLSLASP